MGAAASFAAMVNFFAALRLGVGEGAG